MSKFICSVAWYLTIAAGTLVAMGLFVAFLLVV